MNSFIVPQIPAYIPNQLKRKRMQQSIQIFQCANGWLVELPFVVPEPSGISMPDFTSKDYLKKMVTAFKDVNRDPLLGPPEDEEPPEKPKKKPVKIPSRLPAADERFFLFLDYKEMIEFLERLT